MKGWLVVGLGSFYNRFEFLLCECDDVGNDVRFVCYCKWCYLVLLVVVMWCWDSVIGWNDLGLDEG